MHGVIQECKSERARRIRHRHAADDTVYCWNIIRSTLYYSITTKINISPLLTLVITHKRTKYKVMMQNLPADCRLIQKEIVAQCCDSLYCWVCDGLGCCCFYAFPLPFVFFFSDSGCGRKHVSQAQMRHPCLASQAITLPLLTTSTYTTSVTQLDGQLDHVATQLTSLTTTGGSPPPPAPPAAPLGPRSLLPCEPFIPIPAGYTGDLGSC